MSRKIQAEYSPSQIRAAFKIFDKNDTGFVRADVLEHALTTYGNNRITQEEAMDLISAADPDNTGRINYNELVNMMSTK